MDSATTTSIGTTTNHQNNVQTTTANPPAAGATMPSPGIALEGLFDATGQHLGGLYSPLMIGGDLTAFHADCLAIRPAHLLIYQVGACLAPHDLLALVWMMPAVAEGVNPLASSPAVLSYLVAAMEAGSSVKLHAARMEDIEAVQATLATWLGGWHA